MWFFSKLFKKKPVAVEQNIKPEVNLSTIKQFDDVWIKINGNVLEGWITKKENGILFIVYTNIANKLEETSFKIERPLDRQLIVQGKKTLYLTKEAID